MPYHRKVAAVACAAAILITTSAGAAVVGISPNADLSQGAFVFDLGGGTSYVFSNSGQGGAFGFGLAAVQTTGSATVASLGPPFFSEFRPTTYFTDSGRAPFIDGALLASFQSYQQAVPIGGSETDSFIALQFERDGNAHFGFARIAGLTLFDLAYETSPNTGIQAGDGPFTAPPAPVPLPAALPLLLLGLGGLGLAARKRGSASA